MSSDVTGENIVDIDKLLNDIVEHGVPSGEKRQVCTETESTSCPTPPSTLDDSDTAKHSAEVDVIQTVPADIEEIEEQKDDQSECASEAVATRVFHVSSTVRAGGVLLAFCAGMVNIMSFRVFGVFVSHMTGTVSKIGMGMEDSDSFNPGDMGMLVVSFVFGSTLTGFMIAKDTIHFGMALYDLCLMTESGLLIAAAFAHESEMAKYFATIACGVQNGMATHWGGAVIRTTHVTGCLTDVGLLLGRMLSLCCRKRCGRRFDDFDRAFLQDDISKLSVLVMILVAFLAGAFTGAHLYNALDNLALLVPASITGVIGVMYSIYRVFVLHQSFFSDAEMEAIDVPAEMQEGFEEFRKASKTQYIINNPAEVAEDEAGASSRPGSQSHPLGQVNGADAGSRPGSQSSQSKIQVPSNTAGHLSRKGSKTHHGEVMSISRQTAEELENSHLY